MSIYRAKQLFGYFIGETEFFEEVEGQLKIDASGEYFIYDSEEDEEIQIDPSTLEVVSIDLNDTQRLQLIRCAFQHLGNCLTELRNANRDRYELHKVEPRIYFVAKTLKDVNELLKGI
jgi:preprotein translocase subunit Sec61beta